MIGIAASAIIIATGFVLAAGPSATVAAKSVFDDVSTLAKGARALYADTATYYASLSINDAWFHGWIDDSRFRRNPRSLFNANTGGQYFIGPWASFPALTPLPGGMGTSEGFFVGASFSDAQQCQTYARLAVAAFDGVWIGTTQIFARPQGYTMTADRRDALCPNIVYISSY